MLCVSFLMSLAAALVILIAAVLIYNHHHPSTAAPSSTSTTTTTATPTAPTASTPGKTFAPYLLLSSPTAANIGKYSTWTTLAFVVGYSGSTIKWDSGAVSASTVKSKANGHCIVSFGGQTAGSKKAPYYNELAGKYTDSAKLADAYAAVANALGATILDFDVEEDAVHDTAACERRHAALAALQKKNPAIRIHFTVPVEMAGVPSTVKTMLQNAKKAGVSISVVNLMTMYFNKSGTKMADACWKAVDASRSFITGLGAKIGITPQIGKNPDAPYTKENFTLADATALVAKAKADPDVALMAFWEVGRDAGGKYAAAFKSFET